MKKFATLLAVLIVSTAIFAQKGKVTSALSYKESGDLEKAWSTIQLATDANNEKAEKSLNWPRAWEVKGEILQEIFRKNVEGLVEEPLFEAFDCYKKAIELDVKSRYSKSVLVNLTFLQTDFSNYAIKAYEAEKFDIAMKCFENYMELSNHPLMNVSADPVIDTAIIYNAALAAFKATNWEKAIKYFNASANHDYNGAASYYYTFLSYQATGDTLGSLKVLKDGFEAYPENETLIVELINFYIKADKADEAVDYLDLAIKGSPENVSFYTAKGATLEKLGKEDEAVEVYKQAIEIDETQFTPYYNLGVIFYNRGVSHMNAATQLPPSATEEYDKEVELGMVSLRDALPYIEKAYSLDDSEMAIMESLRLIYYRLKMTDKYDEINEKIQSIGK